MSDQLVAPFPWFGGKSRAAAKVWELLGAPDNYVEPFGGSAAVLLARPGGPGKVETYNDADGLLVNLWRSIAWSTEETAEHADWPVSEADLSARHLWLVARREEIRERVQADPSWHDPQAAGWWLWGACAWIGSGWCSGEGPWVLSENGARLDLRGNAGQGINRKLPHLGNAGRGINRKLPHLGDAGQGINRNLPHLGDAGRGINRKLPHLGDAGRGINRKLPHLGDAGRGILEWLTRLADRLRRVRITCGDWRRVTTPSVVERHGTSGVYLDPPYPEGWDPSGAYSGQDGGDVCELWGAVKAHAIQLADRGARVVVSGYDGTWPDIPAGWTVHEWTARKGYATSTEDVKRERLWASPGCAAAPIQVGLWSNS